MMIIFLALTAYLLIMAPLRLWSAVHLMTHYKTDDFLSDPHARRLWIFHFASALTIGPVILIMTYLSGIWWLEAAGWIVCVLVTLRVGQKVKMRLDGSSKEFYQKIQWQ